MASIISAGTTSGTSLNLSGDTSGVLQLASNGSTTAVTIDTSQNVGIGTSSPSQKLEIVNGGLKITSGGYNIAMQGSSTSGTLNGLVIASVPRVSTDTGTFENTYIGSGATYGSIIFQQGNSSTTSSNTERMRIDSSGNVLISTTSNPTGATFVVGAGGSVANFKQSIGAGYNVTTDSQNNGGTYYHMQFTEAGTQRGSITSNGGSTAYNTGSDYRLKDDIASMSGGLNKVLSLKPSTWKWKSTGENGEGFIAHELAEVVPDCVVGTKDQVDEEGNPVYQGIDTSFLVATLTAAIQELNAKVEAQAVRIAELEGAK